MARHRAPVTLTELGRYECKHCSQRFAWVSPRPKGGGKKPLFCSAQCANNFYPKKDNYSGNCLMCGRLYSSKDRRQVTCSRICGQRLKNGWKSVLPDDHWARWYGKTCKWNLSNKPNPRFVAGQCNHCATNFIDTWLATSSAIYCSKQCRKVAGRQRRKLSKRGSQRIDQGINWQSVADRQGLTCHICNDDCDPDDYTYRDGHFCAGITFPTVDHVYPVSRGGQHTWQNVKLAHLWCNSEKNNKVAWQSQDTPLSDTA